MKAYIPKSLRKAVIDRDGYHCVYCDEDLENNEIHMDHLIAESRGGLTTMENLQVTCRKCNLAKGTMTDVAFENVLRQRALNILARLGN